MEKLKYTLSEECKQWQINIPLPSPYFTHLKNTVTCSPCTQAQQPLRRNQQKKNKCLKTVNPAHKLQFGRYPVSFNLTGAVRSVICWFCVAFGTEESAKSEEDVAQIRTQSLL